MLRRFAGYLGLLALALGLILPGAAGAQRQRRWLADPPLLRRASGEAQQQEVDRIFDLEMLDGAGGWATARSGLLSYDGHAWSRGQSFDQTSFLALDFAGPSNGWAVGARYTANQALMAVAHFDGRSWTLSPDFGANGNLRDVAAFSDGTAWAVGEAYAQRSATPLHRIYHFDGAAWSRIELPEAEFGANGMLNSLSMVGPGEGWAGGIFGYAGESGARALRPVILHLKDGRWTEQPLPDLGRATIHQVVMKNASEGWAIAAEDLNAQDGQLLRYQDGAWRFAAGSVPTNNCSVRSVGLVPGTDRGWMSLVRCPDGRERRLRMDNGGFSEDAIGAQVAPEVYALPSDDVQWGAHGGMLMRYSGETLPTARVAPGSERYFPETGHTIFGAFQAYYERHGLDLGDPGISAAESLALFGYPLSEQFKEINPDTGDYLLVQYFERARFEWHPENPDPYKVLLGRFGFTTLLRRGRTPVVPNPTQAPDGPGCQVYPETQYSLCAPFLGYWERNGGLPVFGFPLTDTADELSQTDGNTYSTVWTERERLERHPENAGTPYEILLGLLGAEDLRVRGYLE
jgi:hypothetical protein